MRRILLALALLVPAVVVPTQSSAAGTDRTYIVQFKEGFNQTAQAALAKNMGFSIDIQYKRVLNGFAARLTDAQAVGLSRNPNVKLVEPDQVVTADADTPASSWGQDRVDQSILPLDGFFNETSNGSGISVFVIDTGIRSTHSEFATATGSRVKPNLGFTAISDGRGTEDCAGHGTHVAGTIGGKTYGIAKAVTLIPIRVLDCSGSGTNTGVIAGLDFVTTYMTTKIASTNATPPTAIANMSLGGGLSSSLNTATQNMIKSGVVLAVAAGNSNADACNSSPSSAPDALTVGATDRNDFRATFSNYGTCVDLFAPGVGILSAWFDTDSATNTISGTSMASPHVAGVAALMLGRNPGASWSVISQAVKTAMVPNQVTAAGTGSPTSMARTVAAPAPTAAVPNAALVTVTGTGKTRVSLKWDFSRGVGGQFLTGQRLYVYVGSSTTPQATYQLAANALSGTVGSLSSSQSYRFCVTGLNSKGEGPRLPASDLGCTNVIAAATR